MNNTAELQGSVVLFCVLKRNKKRNKLCHFWGQAYSSNMKEEE